MDKVKCDKCGKLIEHSKTYKIIDEKSKEYGHRLYFKCAMLWAKSNKGYKRTIKFIISYIKFKIRKNKIYQFLAYIIPYIVGYGYMFLCCIHFIINKDLVGLSLLLLFILQLIS